MCDLQQRITELETEVRTLHVWHADDMSKLRGMVKAVLRSEIELLQDAGIALSRVPVKAETAAALIGSAVERLQSLLDSVSRVSK